MKPRLSATKRAPVLEQVAELAMRLSRPHLADYGATTSRHDFTQRQLLSCLVLRAYLKATYRGVLEVLALSPALRDCLGLSDKLPHYTTLQKFSGRSQVVAIVQALIGRIGRAAAAQEPAPATTAPRPAPCWTRPRPCPGRPRSMPTGATMPNGSTSGAGAAGAWRA